MAEGARGAKRLASGLAQIGLRLGAAGAALGLDEGLEAFALEPLAQGPGGQILPGRDSDGFYYALLAKPG